MFNCSCLVLGIFMTITLIFVTKKKYDIAALMLVPTMLVISFTILLAPIKGTVIDMNKIISNDNTIVTEKNGKLEITPAFTYYILVETHNEIHYIIQVDHEINIGDTYTGSLYNTFG